MQFYEVQYSSPSLKKWRSRVICFMLQSRFFYIYWRQCMVGGGNWNTKRNHQQGNSQSFSQHDLSKVGFKLRQWRTLWYASICLRPLVHWGLTMQKGNYWTWNTYSAWMKFASLPVHSFKTCIHYFVFLSVQNWDKHTLLASQPIIQNQIKIDKFVIISIISLNSIRHLQKITGEIGKYTVTGVTKWYIYSQNGL